MDSKSQRAKSIACTGSIWSGILEYMAVPRVRILKTKSNGTIPL